MNNDMNKVYGYAGTNLFIDLSNKKIIKEPLDLKIAQDFIGGMGLSTKLLYDILSSNSSFNRNSSPQDPLIFGAGPLVGTLAPASSRVEALFKSPLTGLMGSANSGNSVGFMLKYAGYDNLIITGKAEGPVYIRINDDDVEILNAQHLWGKDTWEATDRIWQDLGKDYWVSCIGPAGENQVTMAAVINNQSGSFSRTGPGAVMGSKNLKAIAVQGTKGLEIAERKRFQVFIDGYLKKFREFRHLQPWRTLAFTMGLEPYASKGFFAKKNWREGYGDLMEYFPDKEYLKRKRSYDACPSCPLGCKDWILLPDGKYQGLSFRISSTGAQVGWHTQPVVENYDEVIKCVEMENRFGIDSTSATSAAAFAIDLFERGIIDKRQTGGMELKWGSESYRELLRRISYREGIGDVLADGVAKAHERFGKDAQKYAVHIKGLELALGLNGRLCTENFGQVTNPRGGHLERAPSITFTPRDREAFPKFGKAIGIPDSKIEKVCDGPEGFNVARLTKWVEDYNTLYQCLGICHRTPITQYYSLRAFAEVYSAATGFDVNGEDLRQAGERVWNLQRLLNIKCGLGRKDDNFPEKFMSESITICGKSYGPIPRNEVQKLIEEYYEERGWDREGIPTQDKLEELGLSLTFKES